MLEQYVKRILNASVYDVAIQTPLDNASSLSSRINNNVFIKREDLQPVFSFKLRGAYNAMSKLTQEQKDKGIVCASAGNHAQGIAESAKYMGIKATIVMPKTTPPIKVNSVKARGGKVVLHGDAYDDAYEHSQKIVAEKGMTFLHPFDNPDVIAGQGTVARELLQQFEKPIEAVFIPVGGGGLCAGMAAYIKYLRPEIKIIAVEYEQSACLKLAIDKGRRATLSHVGIFADGVAVAQIGKETWSILKDNVDECITVNSDEICAAIKDVFDDTRSVAEPAGALGIAGLKKYVAENNLVDKNVIAVCSGANMNFDRLRYVAERAEVGEQREALLAVTIDEKAGSFKQFCNTIGQRSITEFNYRYADQKQAQIFVGVQTADQSERIELIEELQQKDYQVLDLTNNDMAKSHVRHMVGGHAEGAENEKLYRFEFPERPAALMNFLKKLGSRWNITLFHYRNHGAAYGRVLTGIQIPNKEQKEFELLLSEIGYEFWDETNNPAYQLFLS